jgi:uncharacterized protein (TIGR04255 family)
VRFHGCWPTHPNVGKMIMTGGAQYLNVPNIDSVRYTHNFIKTAVCEFRFPTLLELEEKFPVSLQKKLRKDYPNYSEQRGVTLSSDTAKVNDKRYRFESKKHEWTVTLKPSTLSLETTHYTTFEDFSSRINVLLKIFKDFLDTDYFTRVGLRYINIIPIDNNDLTDWINPELTSLITSGVLGSSIDYRAEIHGIIPEGNFIFRHGTNKEEMEDGTLHRFNYFLDMDYYDEAIEYDNAYDLIDKYHKHNFSLFMWSLGRKAIEKMGRPTPK